MKTSKLATGLRRQRGKQSLNWVAREAQVSPGYLHALEHGTKRNPSTAVLERIAKALGCTVGALLEER